MYACAVLYWMPSLVSMFLSRLMVWSGFWYSIESGPDHVWDNCIEHFHLGRYIVAFMVGNFVLHPILMHFLNFIRQTANYFAPNVSSSAT